MAQLSELQVLIESTRKQRGFTTDPIHILTLLVEEVGKVASEIKKTWSANYPDLVIDDLAGELADVTVLVSALATKFDIDLEEAIHRKFFQADSLRQWPTANLGQDPDDVAQ